MLYLKLTWNLIKNCFVYFSSFIQYQRKLIDDKNKSCQSLKNDTALNQQHVLKFYYKMKHHFQQSVNKKLEFILLEWLYYCLTFRIAS